MDGDSVTFGQLNRQFAERCTAHGFSRLAASSQGHWLRQVLWTSIVVTAIGGFLYHVSFLVSNYFSYPLVTATEEVHADELHFPSITVCNLNIMRRSSFDDYLKDVAEHSGFDDDSSTTKGYEDDDSYVCYRSLEEFLKRSRTMDLSDMWMNFIATKEHLTKFGHQGDELVVQCTYNARNCFDETHSILRVDPYPSPRYGLCQTIKLANESMRKIRKSGPTLGLRLTLNIERDEYLDIMSPEFGARLLIHPMGTAPTLERGGIVVPPGTKTYVSVRMRKIQRLPEPYRGCSKSFNDSKITGYLLQMGLADLIQRSLYTFDYCQTLCREAALLRICGCLDELSTRNRDTCDPCNVTQARCRNRYLRGYTSSSGGHHCKALCLPECVEVRYDLTTSQSEWPNFKQQSWSVKRWPILNKRLEEVGVRWQEVLNATSERVYREELRAFRKNYIRVHIYIQEMNYLSLRDLPAYPLPQLFADLGGCLGLYIGVSAITIFEFMEHLLTLVNYLARTRQRATSPTNPQPRSNVWRRTKDSILLPGQARRQTLLLNARHTGFLTDVRRADRKDTKDGSAQTTDYYGYGWFRNSLAQR